MPSIECPSVQVVPAYDPTTRNQHPQRTILATLERILREIRWRTRAVGAFPDGKSALEPRRG
jgi:hypothetical protein